MATHPTDAEYLRAREIIGEVIARMERPMDEACREWCEEFIARAIQVMARAFRRGNS